MRTVGPYEEWAATGVHRPDLPPRFIARRPHPDRPDQDVLSRRLRLGSDRALHVEHHLTVQCFGTLEVAPEQVVQLLEWFVGHDLEAVLRAEGLPRLAAPAALWTGRQILEALAHAHALGIAHGGLNPSHVRLEQSGAVRVDFTLSVSRGPAQGLTDYVDLRYAAKNPSAGPQPRADLYAVASILFELLTGQAVDRTTPGPWSARAVEPRLPPEVDAVLAAAWTGTSSARDLATMLDHLFYGTLGADDEDGAPIVAAWLQKARRPSGPADDLAGETPTDRPKLSVATMHGYFTRAMMARDQPVEPQDFSAEDDETSRPSSVTDTTTPSWMHAQPPGLTGWSPDSEDTAAAAIRDPQSPATAVARALPAPGVPLYGPAPVRGPPPSLSPPHRAGAPLLMNSAYDPHSLSVPPMVRPARPSVILWMLLGFAVTFFMILVWSWLTPRV